MPFKNSSGFFLVCLVTLFLYIHSTSAILRIITTDSNSGLVDPVSGNISCVAPLPLPDVTPGCQWKFPLVGTRGQTTTVFYQNYTNYFIGQVVCPEGIQKTIVLSLRGPFPQCNGPDTFLWPLYTIDPTVEITDINMYWDHTCNVDILQPQEFPNGTLLTTKQVSAYDAQIRPQANYQFYPTCNGNCWKKVNGFGALDYGSFSAAWSPEYNCGDSCIFWTLEEQFVNGESQPPRALLGRSFRTGGLNTNITDSVQIQTVSYNPMVYYLAQQNQFVGIGICCTDAWCHPDCTRMNLGNHMVLINFMPNRRGQEFAILADIGEIIDPDTIRLGVEFTGMFSTSVQKYVYVYYQDTIISYLLGVSNGLILTASRSSQSPKINLQLVAWGSGLVD